MTDTKDSEVLIRTWRLRAFGEIITLRAERIRIDQGCLIGENWDTEVDDFSPVWSYNATAWTWIGVVDQDGRPTHALDMGSSTS